MSESVVLSDLCKICNNKPPKYCCPRCRCLTCSLPCYRRHKTWSQCSGMRDPAAYMTRSELATPTGIDHDYNYLTRIERSFEKADRMFTNSGISLDDFVEKHKSTKLRLAACLEATGVIIHRAPRGMSRQKQNSTHVSRFNGQDCVSWTIEWILLKTPTKLKNAEDHVTVHSAYMSLLGTHRKATHKRRKLNKPSNETEELMGSSGTFSSQALGSTESTIQQHEFASVESNNSSSELMASARYNKPTDDSQSGQTNSIENQSDTYFYLLKPRTVGSARILIPLSPSEIIRKMLRNREVLEFPTIYVLKEAPNSLPSGFQLEHEYIIQERKWIKELNEELKPLLDVNLSSNQQEEIEAERSTDSVHIESRVLESLKRDLASATETIESL